MILYATHAQWGASCEARAIRLGDRLDFSGRTLWRMMDRGKRIHLWFSPKLKLVQRGVISSKWGR